MSFVSLPRLKVLAQTSMRDSKFAFTIGTLLILVLFFPSFSIYMQTEDFNWLSHYYNNNRSIIELWTSPFSSFYRPMAWTFITLTQDILPTNPIYQHVRNFIVISFNLWLILKIVRMISGDGVGLLTASILFAANLVHSFSIGWINLVESSLTVTFMLLSIYYLIRFLQSRLWIHILIFTFSYLSMSFCRDYPFTMFAPLIFLVLFYQNDADGPVKFSIKDKNKLALYVFTLAIVYMIARYYATDGRFYKSAGPSYTPNLFLPDLLFRIYVYTSAILNIAIPGVFYSSESLNYSRILMQYSNFIQIILFILIVYLVVIMLKQKKMRWLTLFVFFAIGCFLGPASLVGNIQPYYTNESIALIAILLGIMATKLERLNKNYLFLVLLYLSSYIYLGKINGSAIKYTSFVFTSDILKQGIEEIAKAQSASPINNIHIWTTEKDRPLAGYIFLSNNSFAPKYLLENQRLNISIGTDLGAILYNCPLLNDTLNFAFSDNKVTPIRSCKVRYPMEINKFITKGSPLIFHADTESGRFISDFNIPTSLGLEIEFNIKSAAQSAELIVFAFSYDKENTLLGSCSQRFDIKSGHTKLNSIFIEENCLLNSGVNNNGIDHEKIIFSLNNSSGVEVEISNIWILKTR